jgi:hypothetical protein
MANIPISSFTAAPNATGIGMSGFSLTGANAQSMLDLAGTWNTSGTPTGLKLNVTDTASNAASLLMDLQTGGVSRFNVDKTGALTLPAGASNSAPSLKIGTNVGLFSRVSGSLNFGGIGNFTIEMTSGEGLRLGPNQLGWGASVGGNDLIILRDAANILAQRNGTNAQTFRVYNTFTDASNYERGVFDWTTQPNALTIGTQQAGSGTARSLRLSTQGDANLLFVTNSVTRFDVSSLGLRATANLIWTTDNTFDIGATGANRPRSIYAAADILAQNNTSGFYLGASADVAILRDEANALALRRTTNPQTFRVYNTSTDASNYERGFMRWSANALQIGAESAGTGVARGVVLLSADHLDLQSAAARSIRFAPAGTTTWLMNSSGHFIAQTDNTYDIGATAVNRPRDLWLGRNADVRGSVYIGGFVEFLGISAGVVCLRQFATSDFNRLQFGGTTSSFPALKRNATALETKLADDSAFAPHAMQYLDVTDGITAPGAAAGRARIYVDTADGDLKVVFADGTVKTIVTDT